MSSNDTCGHLHCDGLFLFQNIISYPLASAAIIFQIICITLVPKVGIFPGNVKLLLVNSSIAALLVSITFLIRAFYNTCIAIFGYEALIIELLPCLIVDAPYGWFSMVFVFSMLALSLERAYETMRHSPKRKTPIQQNVNTDEASRKAKFVVVLIWLVSPSWAISSIVGVASARLSRPLCYCIVSVVHERQTDWRGKGSYFSLVICALVLIWAVWKINRNRLADFSIYTNQHSLQARFRASNNMNTTAMLFPYVLLHAVFYTLLVVLNYVNNMITNDNSYQISSTINMQLFLSIISCIDFLVGPLVWMKNHQGLKTVAAQKYPFLKKMLMTNAKTSPNIATVVTNQIVKKQEKRILPSIATVSKKNVIEYRIKPDQHNQILQHLWSK